MSWALTAVHEPRAQSDARAKRTKVKTSECMTGSLAMWYDYTTSVWDRVDSMLFNQKPSKQWRCLSKASVLLATNISQKHPSCRSWAFRTPAIFSVAAVEYGEGTIRAQ